MTKHNHTLTVITVVKNDQENIEKTIKSVISNNKGFKLEYIVIDGKSQDKTLSIVRKYKDKISKIISEKDNGIYDAMNRAIKISTLIQNGKSAKKWYALRDEIYDDIHKNAWNKKKKAFTQSYGSDYLDASVLLMEQYGFIRANDKKYVQTVKCIEKELLEKKLMYRYKNDDDFGLPSSSFTVCTFWFINSLNKIGLKSSNLNFKKEVDKSLEDFADLIEENIDVSEIFNMAG